MPKRSLIDQLEQAVQAMLVRPDAENLRPDHNLDPSLAPLLGIAQELRDLPRENFKARLKSDLERKSSMASHPKLIAATRQTATPRLRIKNAAAAIEFYKKAFGAKEIMRFAGHGEIFHAEIAIGNSVVMLGEEALEYGFPGPETLGGSPVSMHLYVEDVDALAKQAVAAGARIVSPVEDQFYGDRSGGFADPFGYTWTIATRKEDMSLEEMHRRFDALTKQKEAQKPAADPIRKGFRTLTPYLVVQDAPGLIDFVKRTFAARETLRTIGSAGGIHCEVRIGDSMLMIGGGGPGLSWHGEAGPMAFHVYVKDTDAVYQRALEAGSVSIQAPADQSYGERSGSVKDPFGNHWYIATFLGATYFSEGAPTVQPYLHPLRAEPVIHFLKRAFGAKELGRYATPDGVIHHTTVKIGDSALEMGEAHGPYQPMPGMFSLYVPDVDAVYRRTLEAGATSTAEPADQPYGARTAAVKDAFGNQWYIATHISNVKP
jgi:PhnB protein